MKEQVVFCKHDMCKEEPSCLYFQMAKARIEELDMLEEGLGDEFTREELEQMF